MKTMQTEESKENKGAFSDEIIDKAVQSYQILIKSKLLTNLGKLFSLLTLYYI
jgi:hypothetical protein